MFDPNDHHYYGLGGRSGCPPVPGAHEPGPTPPGGDPDSWWSGGIGAGLRHPDGDPTRIWAESGPYTSSVVALADFPDLKSAAAFVVE